MSWIDDASIKELKSAGYFEPEIDEEIDSQFEKTIVIGNGLEICKNCGSGNIKISQKGNKYCAEICWQPKEQTNE